MNRFRQFLWPKSLAGKAGVVGVGLILLLFATWLVTLTSTQRRLDAALGRAESLGAMPTWDELLGRRVADAENAAVLLAAAGKLASPVLDRAPVARAALDSNEALLLSASASLVGNAEYDRLIVQVDERERYRSLSEPTDGDRAIRDRLNAFYDVSRIEIAATATLMQADKREEAVRRALRLLRITRKYTANEPWLLAQYLGHWARWVSLLKLNETLRTGPLSPPLHHEIEKELARHDDADRVAIRGVIGSRAKYVEWVQGESRMHQSWLTKPMANAELAYIHELHNAYVSTIGESYRTTEHLFKMRHPLHGVPLPRGWGAENHAVELLRQSRVCFDQSVALTRCLRIVNAMAAKNDFNASLHSLGLPESCLIDPLDGERMRTIRTPDGPIVYSIGGDLKDDGGQLDETKLHLDVGYGPVKAGKK
jgi:hypothetical protein